MKIEDAEGMLTCEVASVLKIAELGKWPREAGRCQRHADVLVLTEASVASVGNREEGRGSREEGKEKSDVSTWVKTQGWPE